LRVPRRPRRRIQRAAVPELIADLANGDARQPAVEGQCLSFVAAGPAHHAANDTRTRVRPPGIKSGRLVPVREGPHAGTHHRV